MSLWSMIEHVRKQPESVRVRYLFTSVGVSFLFIFTIWTFSIRESFKEIADNNSISTSFQEFQKTNGPVTENAETSLTELMKAGNSLQEIGTTIQNQPTANTENEELNLKNEQTQDLQNDVTESFQSPKKNVPPTIDTPVDASTLVE